MSTARYFILENDLSFAFPEPRPSSIGGFETRGFNQPGFAPRAAAPFRLPPTKSSTVEMTARDAASERTRRGVRVVGRAMPITLLGSGEKNPPRGAPLLQPTQPIASDAGIASWGLGACMATKSKLDGTGVVVAVLDTGIDSTHPSFHGVAINSQDFTGEGNAQDVHGHGSHCAGTIFGRDVNNTRIGVARGITNALIGKVIPDQRTGDSGMLFDALNWASKEGANTVSMSLGFDFPGMIEQLIDEGLPPPVAASQALVVFSQNLRAFDALMAGYRAQEPFGRNMLVIAAAGNESKRDPKPGYTVSVSMPAAAVGVVSVAAYGRNGAKYEIAPFSNTDALICGPGVDILSAAIGGGLAEMSGTSQACPHVAGIAALWWQKIAAAGGNPTPDKVREQMFAAATTAKLPSDAEETDRGRGRVLAP